MQSQQEARARRLRRASARGDVEVVLGLLREDPKCVHVVGRRKRWTALHHAAKGGNVAVLRLLVDCGASPFALGRAGNTALHLLAHHAWSSLDDAPEGLGDLLHAIAGEGNDVLPYVLPIENKRGEKIIDIARRKGNLALLAWLESARSTVSEWTLMELNNDVLLHLIRFLSPRENLSVGATCQRLHLLTRHDNSWTSHLYAIQAILGWIRTERRPVGCYKLAIDKAWLQLMKEGTRWRYPGAGIDIRRVLLNIGHVSQKVIQNRLKPVLNLWRPPQHDISLKLMVAGEWNVGKSVCAHLPFIDHKNGRYAPPYQTFPEYETRIVGFDNLVIKLTVEEFPSSSCGQPAGMSVDATKVRNCDGVVVCFEAHNKDTLDGAKYLVQAIKLYTHQRPFSVLLAATKTDRKSCSGIGATVGLKQTETFIAQAETFAGAEGVPFVCTSAKSGAGVEDAFLLAVRDMWSRGLLAAKLQSARALKAHAHSP